MSSLSKDFDLCDILTILKLGASSISNHSVLCSAILIAELLTS